MISRSVSRCVSLATRCVLIGVLLLMASVNSWAQGSGGLVSWWPGNGNFKDVVSGNNGTPVGGVLFLPADYGVGFFFNGLSARIHVPDVPSLAITGSMAITAWVWVGSYPTNQAWGWASILTRSADGLSYCTYAFGVQAGGAFDFSIAGSNNSADWVSLNSPKPIPLGTFVFIAATLDDATGLMSLYENGKLVAHTTTTIRPFADLNQNDNPGIGIGNTQSAAGGAYFEGIIDDLKIYNTADPQITPVKLSLNHATVKGGGTVTATLTLNDSPIQPAVVSVSSTVAAATVPGKVTVAAGRYGVAFTIKTQAVTTSQSG